MVSSSTPLPPLGRLSAASSSTLEPGGCLLGSMSCWSSLSPGCPLSDHCRNCQPAPSQALDSQASLVASPNSVSSASSHLSVVSAIGSAPSSLLALSDCSPWPSSPVNASSRAQSPISPLSSPGKGVDETASYSMGTSSLSQSSGWSLVEARSFVAGIRRRGRSI